MKKLTTLILIVSLFSGIGLPFGIPTAAAAEQEEKYPDNIDITELRLPQEKPENTNPKLGFALDRLILAEEQDDDSPLS